MPFSKYKRRETVDDIIYQYLGKSGHPGPRKKGHLLINQNGRPTREFDDLVDMVTDIVNGLPSYTEEDAEIIVLSIELCVNGYTSEFFSNDEIKRLRDSDYRIVEGAMKEFAHLKQEAIAGGFLSARRNVGYDRRDRRNQSDFLNTKRNQSDQLTMRKTPAAREQVFDFTESPQRSSTLYQETDMTDCFDIDTSTMSHWERKAALAKRGAQPQRPEHQPSRQVSAGENLRPSRTQENHRIAQKPFDYNDVPLASKEKYRKMGLDVDDEAFIASRPINPIGSFRNFLYDPTRAEPVWAISDDGYRQLQWREVMDVKNHVIPDYARNEHWPTAPRKEVFSEATSTSMIPIDAIKDATVEKEEKYKEELEAWEKAAVDGKNSEKKPTPPEPIKLNKNAMEVSGVMNTTGVSDTITKMHTSLAEINFTTHAKGYQVPIIYGVANMRKFAWLSKYIGERDSILSSLGVFAYAYHQSDNVEELPMHKVHAEFMALKDVIPRPMWLRLNQYLTDFCNDIFTISMGFDLTINDFSDAGGEIEEYLVENYGEKSLTSLTIALKTGYARLGVFAKGEKEDDCIIYEINCANVTCLPITLSEAGLSSMTMHPDKSNSKTCVVSEGSSGAIYNLLRKLNEYTERPHEVVKQHSYLSFSDGAVCRVDFNALISTMATKRHITKEYLLTKV